MQDVDHVVKSPNALNGELKFDGVDGADAMIGYNRIQEYSTDWRCAEGR